MDKEKQKTERITSIGSCVVVIVLMIVLTFVITKILPTSVDPEGTVIAAVKHNGKTFASGIKLVPDDPRANIIQVKWLARALTSTIRNL